MSGEKIIFDCVKDTDKAENLPDVLKTLSDNADAPTPLVLKEHISHFKKFNIVRFKPADFVESVDFTSMVIELIPDRGKRKKNPFYI